LISAGFRGSVQALLTDQGRMTPSSQLIDAVRQHQAGQFEAADQLYGEAIAVNPADVHALHLRGVLAHQTGRNEAAVELIGRAIALEESAPDFHHNIGLALWALGRRQEATTHWARVLALNPDHPGAHINLGNAVREQGEFALAARHLRRAVELQPQSPIAHNNLGLALVAIGDRSATAHYQRAIDLAPQFIEPHLNLALEYARTGHIDQSLDSVRRSLQIRETPDNTTLFTRVIGSIDAFADDPGLRQLITRAALENWGRATDLAPAAASLLKLGSAIETQIAFREPAWPALTNDRLLRWLLESAVICDLDLESFLTATRSALLGVAETTPDGVDENMLRFACALARQCFSNEYIYATTDDELARAAKLREAGAALSPLRLAVVAAYETLSTLSDADALLAKSWPEPVTPLLTQQVREPRAEAAVRDSIPRLTPIDDDISRLVRAQYEQSPYPRWSAAGEVPHYQSIDALMQREFPQSPYRPSGKREVDILISGCGTGQHSIGVAQQFPHARTLAVDLSLASLAYATTRARALGVNNVEHAQADILQLPSLGRMFDMIQSVGVLHHLGDPWAGWRTLLSLLRPNGVMFVGLYSETGRRDVVAARKFIAERGYGSIVADIRRCRQDLLAQPAGAPEKNVSMFNDFFSTSECRDLLFHVQEHRMTLTEIKRFIVENGLRFLGFAAEPRLALLYMQRFPNDTAMLDFDNWHTLEQDFPYAFAGMYRFWVQKPE
jgi:tetratricopeptide (TPR) repeat protein/2-polyprenyl-3-methyl-5-hydroxy-6-metoxy-1,4-benzoquinol methylase